MKGDGSGTFLLIAVAMGVLISGMIALALTQQLQPLFQTTVDDAGAITEVEIRAEYLADGYLAESARFSFYQAGYEVGNYTIASGMGSVKTKFGSNNGGWSGSDGIERFYDNLFEEMEDEGDDEFTGYADSLENASPRCTIKTPDGGYDFGIAKEAPNIEVQSSNSGEPIVEYVACARRGIQANYSINKDKLNISTDSTHIHNMAWATQLALGEMWNKSEDIDGSDHEGQITKTTACYDPGDIPNWVKDNARSQAEQEAYNEIRDVVEEIAQAGHDGLFKVTNEVGIPFVDDIINFIDTGFEAESGIRDGIVLHENKTDINQVSTSTNECSGDSNCVEWKCTSSEWDYDDAADDCEPSGGYPSQSCTEGDIDESDNVCEDTSVSESDCNSRGDWTWDASENRCIYNDDKPCELYDGKDLDTDGFGGCELAAGESKPSPTCNDRKERYKAVYDYELKKVKYDISIWDKSSVPTSVGGSTNVPLKRRFVYDFP